MNELVDWIGRTEDIPLSYDAGILKSPLLPGEIIQESGFPSIIYPTNDNFRDVADAVWEDDVSRADRIDYMLAICSGTIAGIIDIFYVGDFSLERAQEWGSEQVNTFVKRVAYRNNFKYNPRGLKGEEAAKDELEKAIKHLEDNFKMAADANVNDFGGGLQHHFRDFSHHFSLAGLLFSLFTQFSGKVVGTDVNGTLLIVDVKDTELIGKNFEEKILYGVIDWFFHLVSDMAGSHDNAGEGTGIPGPLVSFLKRLSALPCFKNAKKDEMSFRKWVSKLFNGTLLGKRDENGKIIEGMRFDLRMEIGVLHEVGRQFVPVLINECLVRGLYFIRRLGQAIEKADIHSVADFKNIDPSELLPFNNRVIRRMVTVASGTFTAIDIVDAGVRAAIKNQGINPGFAVDFAVRINFVGIGRFVIACKMDWDFITEDIGRAKEERDKAIKEYEKIIADLKCLSLDYEQIRVLYSLERLSVWEDTIFTKKPEELQAKAHWRAEWEKIILDGMHVSQDSARDYFLTRDEISDFFRHSHYNTWWYLIAMEAMIFTPYYPLYKDDRDKEYKKLKYDEKYVANNICTVQNEIHRSDLLALQKEYKRAGGIITGSTKNVVIGVVGTTAAIAATGGLAFAFAPVIAPVLVGEAAAGLSGAALVNFSLATIGGGALAAGGLGMAGGTAVITGGGALIGMIGGAGISAATTVNLMADEGYVLNECCRLLTFSKVVLAEKYRDFKTIRGIKDSIDVRIAEVQTQIDEFSQKTEEESDEQKKNRKLKVKVATKSVRYLKRCSAELGRIAGEPDKTPASPGLIIRE